MPDPEPVVLLAKAGNFVGSALRPHAHIPEAPFPCTFWKYLNKPDQPALPEYRYRTVDSAHINILVSLAMNASAESQWRQSDR